MILELNKIRRGKNVQRDSFFSTKLEGGHFYNLLLISTHVLQIFFFFLSFFGASRAQSYNYLPVGL